MKVEKKCKCDWNGGDDCKHLHSHLKKCSNCSCMGKTMKQTLKESAAS